MINIYTRTWFELFLETRPYTEQETNFVIRNLPNPPYKTILDVCCGQGRHTNLLAVQGYEMTGIDLDGTALSIAKQNAPETVRYFRQDMRDLDKVNASFDAIIILWQSFGYFDEATNQAILQKISQKLNKQGRLILDIYNRRYWENHQGSKRFEKKDVQIESRNIMVGNRLTSQLVYGEMNESESFEWQLYYLEEIVNLAAQYDLKCLLSCVESDERKAVNDEKPQMQIVFEKGIPKSE